MKLTSIVILTLGLISLLSCRNPMTLETNVHEDGTLDKSIVFEEKDSTILEENIFGINAAKGWKVSMTMLPNNGKNDDNKDKYRVKFEKHFNSAEEINAELNTDADARFSIKSTFEKKFRGFYTYIMYSETFKPINRFKMLPAADFFNQEDFQFIERLPNEGSKISKADSVFLQILNLKIQDYYVNMAFFNEQYEILKELVKRSNLDKKWLDTLQLKREFIYDHVDKMKGDPNFALKIADSLDIPLAPERAARDEDELSKGFDERLNFMSFAKDGQYKNIINMPWQVVTTNADSVSGNKLFWRPYPNKFMFTEYVMYAESRKLNVGFSLVSGIVFLLTLFVWLRRRS